MSHMTDFHPLEMTSTEGSGAQSPVDPSVSLSPSSSTSTAELVSISAPVNIPLAQNKSDHHLNIGQHGEISMSAIPVSDEFENSTIFGSFAMTQSLRSDPDAVMGVPRAVQRAISTSPRMEHERQLKEFGEDGPSGNCSPTVMVEDPFFPFLNPDLDGDMVSSATEMSTNGMSTSLISDVNKVTATGGPATIGHAGGKRKRWTISKGLSEADIGPFNYHHKNAHHGGRIMTSTASTTEVQPARRAGIPILNSNAHPHSLMSRQLSRQSSKGLRRKSSITSNLSFVGNYVFGSTIFQSPTRSATSMNSERVNIVTDSLGVYPSMLSLMSADIGVLPFEDELVVPLSASQPKSASAYSSRQNSRQDLQQDGMDRRKGYVRSFSNISRGSSASLSTRLGSKESEDKVSLRDDEEALDKLTDVKPVVSRIIPPSKKQWQQTMPDLVEGPESDTLTIQSTVRKNLAAAALAMARMDVKVTQMEKSEDGKGEEEGEDSDREGAGAVKVITPGSYMKNLYVLCLVFFFAFSAYMSLRNLQSSLNDSGGLGMYSLSCIYAFLFFGSFFTTTIVQRLRPKFSMLISLIGLLVYNICNFYPSYATLIPGSCIVGFSLATIWTSQATYMANNASSFASATGQRFQDCLSRFHGIFFASFQVSQMVGGAISSIIFSFQPPDREEVTEDTFQPIESRFGSDNRTLTAIVGNVTYQELVDTTKSLTSVTMPVIKNVSSWLFEQTHLLISDEDPHSSSPLVGEVTLDSSLIFPLTNETVSPACGMLHCPGQKKSVLKIDFDPYMYYIMVGVFVMSTVLSILILLFCLDPLEGSMKNPRAGILNQLSSVFRLLVDPNIICLLPFMSYTLLQTTFVFGEFNKAFVTCYLGIYMIGYLTVCLSFFSSSFAFVTGSLQKYIGPEVIIISGLLAHLSILISFWIWSPSKDQTFMFFIIAAIWGAGDGMVTTQIISLLGILFVNKKEAVFSTYKMVQSSSACLLFITGPYFCTRTKVVVLTIVDVLAIIGYITLKTRLHVTNKKSRQLPEPISKRTVEVTKK